MTNIRERTVHRKRRARSLTRMGVETEEEEEGLLSDESAHASAKLLLRLKAHEMVSVPERFERLSANLVMSSRVHQEHQEQHDVTGEAAWLSVHNTPSCLLANLSELDVEHVDIFGEASSALATTASECASDLQ